MADTRVQVEVEDWVRREWMPGALGQKFHRERLLLTSGGRFDFDAVSADDEIVATISTSKSKTRSGQNAVGKLMKLRSDMLFLLMASCERRLVVLTDPGMHAMCEKEKENGRVPKGIEFFVRADSGGTRQRLTDAQDEAADEVSPSHS
jgi:hypothetical protein